LECITISKQLLSKPKFSFIFAVIQHETEEYPKRADIPASLSEAWKGLDTLSIIISLWSGTVGYCLALGRSIMRDY
jgi:hypothetical protein